MKRLNAKAAVLLAAVKKEMKTDDDAVAIEMVKMRSAESLARIDGSLSALSADEMHHVIANLLEDSQRGDGIEFRGDRSADTAPMWIAATFAEAGRLPSTRDGDRRWIRMDRIVSVFAHPSLATSEDPRDWLYSLTFVADGREYHASPQRLRGAAALEAVDKILRAVAVIVRQ